MVILANVGESDFKRTNEAVLRMRFSYPAHVQVFTLSQLRQIIEASPFDGGDQEVHCYV